VRFTDPLVPPLQLAFVTEVVAPMAVGWLTVEKRILEQLLASVTVTV
jgi:hypothetical protein